MPSFLAPWESSESPLLPWVGESPIPFLTPTGSPDNKLGHLNPESSCQGIVAELSSFKSLVMNESSPTPLAESSSGFGHQRQVGMTQTEEHATTNGSSMWRPLRC